MGGSEYIFILIASLLALGVSVVLLGVQRRGEMKDRLIEYMLEYGPNSVDLLDSNERVLRWTQGPRSLTVTYDQNAIQDITYRYFNFDRDFVLTGKVTTLIEFDEIYELVMGG